MLKFTFKQEGGKDKDIFEEINREIRRQVEKIGEEAVEYAVENGTYRNVTGRARASNHYEVDKDMNLHLYNDCGYADDLEARGEDVIGGATLFAEKRLKETFE